MPKIWYALSNNWANLKMDFYWNIDCRPRSDYNQGHIICAKNIKTVIFIFCYYYYYYAFYHEIRSIRVIIRYINKTKTKQKKTRMWHVKNDDGSFRLPYEAELHSRNNIVVYDGNTSSLLDDSRQSLFIYFIFKCFFNQKLNLLLVSIFFNLKHN